MRSRLDLLEAEMTLQREFFALSLREMMGRRPNVLNGRGLPWTIATRLLRRRAVRLAVLAMLVKWWRSRKASRA